MKRTYTYRELLTKQAELNSIVDPNWQDNLDRDDFGCASIEEFAEILGSVRWKWWKASKDNLFNLKIELIDVLHFQLSAITQNYDTTYFDVGLDDVICSTVEKAKPIITNGHLNRKRFVMSVIGMLEYPNIDALEEFLAEFGLTPEEVGGYYTAKRALNKFRQSEGYKTGSYDKHRAGVEDNEIMKKSIDSFLQNKLMSVDELEKEVIQALNQAYGIDEKQLSLI